MRDDSIRQNRHKRRSGSAWHNPQHGGIAHGIAGLIQRQLQRVGGRRDIGRRIPTGIELDGGHSLARIGLHHGQFIFAPSDRRCNLHPTAGG